MRTQAVAPTVFIPTVFVLAGSMLLAPGAALAQEETETEPIPEPKEVAIEDTFEVAPFHVTVVSSPHTLAVGESGEIQAVTAPPAAATGGTVSWQVLRRGGGTFSAPNSETTSFTLLRPSEPGNFLDVGATDVEITYNASGQSVETTARIHIDDDNHLAPFVSGWKFDVVGKPGALYPEPGDTVVISPVHTIPAGFSLASETVTVNPTVLTLPSEGILEAAITVTAVYDNDDGESVTDSVDQEFGIPFSSDQDANGLPDAVDQLIQETQDLITSKTTRTPAENDPVRMALLMGWAVAFQFQEPQPIFTYDPNCPPGVIAYYIVSSEYIEFCPPAFASPWRFIMAYLHEMKHRYLHHLDPFRYSLYHQLFGGSSWDHPIVEAQTKYIMGLLTFNALPMVPGDLALDPPAPDLPVYNVEQGSSVSLEVTISNQSSTHSLDSIGIEVGFIETSLGISDPQVSEDLYISAGPNGIADTRASGDDTQVLTKGKGWSEALVVEAGKNGVLDSVPAGDDILLTTKHIAAGPNGIADTRASGDDTQALPVGKGHPVGAVVEGNRNKLATTPAGDDVLQAPPTTFIEDFTVISVPSSIPAGGSGTASFSFNVSADISSHYEFAVIDLDLTATKGGAAVKEVHPIQIFVLPAASDPDDPDDPGTPGTPGTELPKSPVG